MGAQSPCGRCAPCTSASSRPGWTAPANRRYRHGDGGERDRGADQGGDPGRTRHRRGPGRRRRPLRRHGGVGAVSRHPAREAASDRLRRIARPNGGRAARPRVANLSPRLGVFGMANDVFERIQGEVNETPVMLYMKGTAMFPQCGFSARVVQILTHLGVPFKTANVLEDEELREGIKQFSQWPTVPQLYVKGEFVGGCDIITEMFQSGELETLLAEKGIEHQTEA